MAVRAEQHALGRLGSHLANAAGEPLMAEMEFLGRRVYVVKLKRAGMIREATNSARSPGLSDELTLDSPASLRDSHRITPLATEASIPTPKKEV
jgi:hypothetical protein